MLTLLDDTELIAAWERRFSDIKDKEVASILHHTEELIFRYRLLMLSMIDGDRYDALRRLDWGDLTKSIDDSIVHLLGNLEMRELTKSKNLFLERGRLDPSKTSLS